MTDIETAIMIKNMAREAVKRATAKNGQLYGSASSLDGMKKIIAQFYYGDPANYSFTETGPDTWSISGPKGIKSGVVVRKAKGRFRFEDA